MVELNEILDKNIYTKTKIPRSEENNDEAEKYADSLMKCWKQNVVLQDPLGTVYKASDRTETERLAKVLQQGLSHAFHSLPITRHYTIILTALGRYKEAIASFNVYRRYQEKARVREVSGGDSFGSSKSDSIELLVSIFSPMIRIMIAGYDYHNELSQVAKELSIFLSDDKVTEGAPESILGLAYGYLGMAYLKLSQSVSNSVEYQRLVSVSLTSFKRSLDLNVQDSAIYVEYAIITALEGNINESLLIVKKGLSVDKGNLQLWHLLALLISSQEDHEMALEAIEQGLSTMDLDSDHYSDYSKILLIEMKKTHIGIIESIAGSKEALGHVEELFVLFSQLYTEYEKIKSPTIQQDNHLQATRSRFSTLRRSRSMSRRSSRVAESEPDAETPYPQFKPGSVPGKLMKQIWLYVAQIYRRAGLLNDSEQSIVEAEKIGGPDANTHCELALLMFEKRPLHALEEFNAALDLDRDHLRSTVGLAQLVLSNSKSDDHELFKTASPASLFVGKENENAARSRLFELLTLLSEKYPGCYNSEVWLLLSEFYTAFKLPTKAQEALFKTVALEETRAVRNYTCIRYFQ